MGSFGACDSIGIPDWWPYRFETPWGWWKLSYSRCFSYAGEAAFYESFGGTAFMTPYYCRGGITMYYHSRNSYMEGYFEAGLGVEKKVWFLEIFATIGGRVTFRTGGPSRRRRRYTAQLSRPQSPGGHFCRRLG